MSDFTTDDVALAIEIQGLYDGTCVWLLKDGRYINRFAGKPGSPASLIARVDAWIAQHGNQIRADNTDLLDTDPVGDGYDHGSRTVTPCNCSGLTPVGRTGHG